MQNKDKKFAGIWLDGKQGIIISETDGEFTIQQRIDLTASQSGGSEHAMNNGKKTESAKYFKALGQQLSAFDEIHIFGPGQAQEQLQHHLMADGQFSGKKLTIDSSEKMTEPQLIATVREFYKGR